MYTLLHILYATCTCYIYVQARDGNSVCVALHVSGQDGKYVIINLQEGSVRVFTLTLWGP